MEINNIIYKMLKQTTDFLDEWKDELPQIAKEYAEALVYKNRDILAMPLRNCDVGTIEEQIKRFYDEYYAKDSRCKRMWSFGECAIHWSQMRCNGDEKQQKEVMV